MKREKKYPLFFLLVLSFFVVSLVCHLEAFASSFETGKKSIIAFLPFKSEGMKSNEAIDKVLTKIIQHNFQDFQYTSIPSTEEVSAVLKSLNLDFSQSATRKQLKLLKEMTSADFLVSGKIFLKASTIYLQVKILNLNSEKYVEEKLKLKGNLQSIDLFIQEATAQIANQCHITLTLQDKLNLLTPGNYDFSTLINLSEALQLYTQSQYKACEKKVLSVLDQSPHFREAIWLYAQLLLRQQKEEKAKDFLIKNTRNNSKGNFSLKILLAQSYITKKEWDKAEKYLNSLLLSHPYDPPALLYLGQVYSEKHLFELAIEKWEAGVEYSFHKTPFLSAIAETLFEKKEYSKALKYIQKAQILSPNNQKNYYLKGIILAHLGAYEESSRALRKSREMTQQQYETKKKELETFLTQNQKNSQQKQAIETYTEKIKKDPHDVATYHALAAAYEQKKQWDLAIQSYKKTIEINPTFAPGYFNLAMNLNRLNKNREALEYFSKGLQLNPKHLSSYIYMGKTYWKLKEYSKTLAIFQKGLEFFPLSKELINKTAEAYAKSGKWQQMEKLYKGVEEKAQAKGVASVWIGKTYLKFGKSKKAVKCFKTSIKQSPDLAEPYLELAKYFDNSSKNKKKAVQYYQHYLSKELDVSKKEFIKKRILTLNQE